jgi:hypothetical protein
MLELYHIPCLKDILKSRISFLISQYWLAIHAHKSVHTHTKKQGDESMGKNWTKEELEQASKVMMANGQMGYEEFLENLIDGVFDIESPKETAEVDKKEVRS